MGASLDELVHRDDRCRHRIVSFRLNLWDPVTREAGTGIW
jgi:hypothetical protein